MNLSTLTDRQQAYLYLHICVILWGFTAILGALIQLEALPLVWWRVLLAGVGMSLFGGLPLLRSARSLSPKTLRQLIGIGMLIGIHWLLFYGAIKKSNASIAVVAIATTSFFSAILEPFFLKKRFNWMEAGIGLLVLPGIYLVVEGIEWTQREGFVLGILAALLAAVFSILNKKMLDSGPDAPAPQVISMVQFWTMVVFLPSFFLLERINSESGPMIQSLLTPVVSAFPVGTAFWPAPSDWLWLVVLAFGCTILPFTLSLMALRHVSAFTNNLILNLEPVYGVFLAAILLHEHKELSFNFYIGVAIILSAVGLHIFLSKKTET